jgi:hypothetical protein
MEPDAVKSAEPKENPTEPKENHAETREQKGPCTTCLEPIWIGAKKCTHCDSYQDWRRFLNFSSTVLALMVSLVAVTTTGVPIIWEVLKGRDSDIRIATPSIENGRVYVLATNFGKKPGTANFLTVVLNLKDDSNNMIWLHLVRSAPNASLLPADDSKELEYATQFPAGQSQSGWNPSNMTSEQLETQKMELRQKSCTIIVNTTSFKGIVSKKCFQLPCLTFLGPLQHYWEDAHRDDGKAIGVAKPQR